MKHTQAHFGAITSILHHPHHELIITAGSDRSIRLFEPRNLRKQEGRNNSSFFFVLAEGEFSLPNPVLSSPPPTHTHTEALCVWGGGGISNNFLCVFSMDFKMCF